MLVAVRATARTTTHPHGPESACPLWARHPTTNRRKTVQGHTRTHEAEPPHGRGIKPVQWTCCARWRAQGSRTMHTMASRPAQSQVTLGTLNLPFVFLLLPPTSSATCMRRGHKDRPPTSSASQRGAQPAHKDTHAHAHCSDVITLKAYSYPASGLLELLLHTEHAHTSYRAMPQLGACEARSSFYS